MWSDRPIRWWGLRPAMAILLANAFLYFSMSIGPFWPLEQPHRNRLPDATEGLRRWWLGIFLNCVGDETLEMEVSMKCDVVLVCEERTSPRGIYELAVVVSAYSAHPMRRLACCSGLRRLRSSTPSWAQIDDAMFVCGVKPVPTPDEQIRGTW